MLVALGVGGASALGFAAWRSAGPRRDPADSPIGDTRRVVLRLHGSKLPLFVPGLRMDVAVAPRLLAALAVAPGNSAEAALGDARQAVLARHEIQFSAQVGQAVAGVVVAQFPARPSRVAAEARHRDRRPMGETFLGEDLEGVQVAQRVDDDALLRGAWRARAVRASCSGTARRALAQRVGRAGFRVDAHRLQRGAFAAASVRHFQIR